jgi:short-subunit dehydrogenase
VLVARNGERMQKLAENLQAQNKVRCEVIPQDLALPGSAKELRSKIEKLGLTIEVLINNAGYGVWGDFAQSDFAEMSGMLQLNMNTLAELTHLFLPSMLAQKSGRILNVASTAAFQAGPWMAGYYASKAFVLSFTEGLAVELEGRGVSITALCPGPTKTEFFDRARMGDSRLKNLVMAESATCVRNGLEAMFDGKVLVVDGWMNRFSALSVKALPRSMTRRVAGYINQGAGGPT